MDRRWGVRVNVNAPGSLRTLEGAETPVSIRDVSLSGAYVKISEHPPLLSRLSIRAPGSARDWMDACVTRIQDDGIGIEWLEPGSQLALTLISLAHATAPSGSAAGAAPALADPVLEKSVKTEALDRARSEIDSGEFDVQG